MKKINILLIIFSFVFQITKAQTSLDSLKLVVPSGQFINSIHCSSDGSYIIASGLDNLATIFNSRTGKEIQTLNGHSKPIYFSYIDSKNKKAITASYDNSIRIWDVQKGIEQIKIEIEGLEISIVNVNLSGDKIISVSNDATRIWNSNTGKILHVFPNYDGIIKDAIFSSSGKYVLTSYDNGKAIIWDANNGAKKNVLEVVKAPISNQVIDGFVFPFDFSFNAEFSPNEELLITTNSKGESIIWDFNKDINMIAIENQKGFNISLHLSPDNKFILKTSEYGESFLWDINKNKKVFDFDGGMGLFSHDGKKIATYGSKGIKIYDSQNGKELYSKIDYRENGNLITKIIFSSDDNSIYTLKSDGDVFKWDFSIGGNILAFNAIKKEVKSTEYSNSGNTICLILNDKTLHIWDVSNNINKIIYLKDISMGEIKCTLSPVGDKAILFTEYSKIAKVIDLNSGEELFELNKHSQRLINANFSSNGEFIVTSSFDSSAIIWDTNSGMLIKQINGDIGNVIFNKDGTKLISTYSSSFKSPDGSISIWNLNSRSLINYLKHKDPIIPIFKLSENGNILIAGNQEGFLMIYDIINYSLIKEINGHSASVNSISISNNSKYFASTSRDSTMKLWDIDSGKLICNFGNHNSYVCSAIFSSDNNYILSETIDGYTYVWDVQNKKLLHKLKGSSPKFYFSNEIISTVQENGSLLFWNIAIGIKFFEHIQLENNNWLVKLTNSPYYMCSKEASKMLHYVTPSLKVIGFEQLDPVYNRPDIVLDSIGKYFGGADQELITNYRQSWEKRIDRLGLDKDKLGKGEISVPNAEIVGADDISYENKNGKLNLNVAANDPKYPLRRFNVFVNEVPLYGSAGISIASLKKLEWDTTLSVPLSTGENKIQVSVMNELGLENFKYPIYVNYTPTETITAKTYYIGIGVNEFKESSHNLNYCVKDVTDLAKSFGGPNTEVKLLTNAQVNKDNILALKDYLSKTSVNDKVIISCSSHGLLDDSLNFYLAMHDVDFKHPQFKGLKYEDLESLLDGIPARQKLLLLDACNSGENDKTEVLNQELKQKESKMESNQLLAARGVIIQLEEENKSNFKKMNELFVNVRNNTGSVIISAAGGQESALEAIEVNGRAIENGAFTYSVLECLEQNKGKELKVNTLKQYTEKRVDEITKGKQKPTSRQETMEVDWDIFLH